MAEDVNRGSAQDVVDDDSGYQLTDAEQAAADAGLEPSQFRSTPQPQTATDAAGTERVTVPDFGQQWQPAPVDPHPDDVAKAEARQALFDEQREGRLNASATGEADPATTTSSTSSKSDSAKTASSSSSSSTSAKDNG